MKNVRIGICRTLAILIVFVFFMTPVFSQNNLLIKGNIVDEKDDPVIGVVVKVANGKEGTVTDFDGNFSINLPVGGELNISYVGYLPQTIKVESEKFLNIILKEDLVKLGEVVVVGYGVQKKESLTGSITNLKNDEIMTTKAPSLAQAIQGKVSGLRIRQESGEPGAFSSNINIRGLGNPLFVIDGVLRDGSSEFQRLNPEDIESISFLKDATAAIYGMNSTNGAIIVTTKKGKVGKTRISLNANYGISKPTDVPKMANAAQYMTMRNEAEINAGRSPYLVEKELLKWQTSAPGYESVDLYGAIANSTASQYQTTLSMEGGSDKITYFGSLGYGGDNSVLKNDAMKYDKYTFRSNVNIKITTDLTAMVNIGGRYDKTNRPWYAFFDIFKSTRVNPPITSIYANDNPAYYNNFSYVPNPAAMIDKDYTGSAQDKNKNIQTQFALEYSLPFLDGLKVKGTLVYDYNDYKFKGIRKAFDTYTYGKYTGIYSASTANTPSLAQDNRRENNRLDLQFQTNYNTKIGESHNIGATYVFERREEKSNWLNGERKYDFFSEPELDYGRTYDQSVSGSSRIETFLSHIGRLTYNYQGKYLAEVAFRYDGSYRYAPGERWVFIPSGSLGWRISEEDFIKNITWVDNLKLRFSAGRSAQDAGDPFQYLEGYYTLGGNGYVFSSDMYMSGVSAPTLVNKNLTWIKSTMYDIGVDFSIFNGLLSGEFDLYQRELTGLLATRNSSLPNTFGASLPQENLNGERTQGVEFTLTHSNKIGAVNYSVSGNFNLARTMRRHVERGEFSSSWDRWKNQASNRWNDFIWGYEVDGRFQNFDQINSSPIQNGDNGNSKELPGDYILVDLNGDGVVNGLDQMPRYWSSTPLIHFGFNIQADWNGFDFYALLQGSALYTVQFDEVYAKMLAFKGGNAPEYFFDRWHLADPYNPNSQWIGGNWPAIRLEQDMGSLYTRNTDVWRKDASYLRLKTIEVGYTFNPKLLKKTGLERLRLYVNGNNLLTFADSFVKAFDPEKIEGAYSAGLTYPLSKSYNFGLSVNF